MLRRLSSHPKVGDQPGDRSIHSFVNDHGEDGAREPGKQTSLLTNDGGYSRPDDCVGNGAIRLARLSAHGASLDARYDILGGMGQGRNPALVVRLTTPNRPP